MKKWLVGILILVMAFCSTAWAEEFIPPARDGSGVIGGQSNQAWRLGIFEGLRIDGVTYDWPSADGTAGYQLQTDGAGTLSWAAAGGTATAWDDIGDPDANSSVTFSTYTSVFTGAATAAHQFQFEGTGNLSGDYGIVSITQKTGTPTGGKLLYATTASTNVDGIYVYNSTTDLTATVGLLGLDYKDDGDSDGTFILCRDNNATDVQFTVGAGGAVTMAGNLTFSAAASIIGPASSALTINPDSGNAAGEDLIVTAHNVQLTAAGKLTMSPDAAETLAIDLTDTDYTNAISVGDNAILGTTGVINYDNFDVDASGNVTCADLTASGNVSVGTFKQDAIVPSSAAPTTLTVDGAGAGGVTIGGTSTGAITLGGGATAVTLPATVDLTLSGGVVSVTDTATANLVTLVNNTMTANSLIAASSTSMTTGKMISAIGGASVSGDIFYAQATEGAGFTGYYFRGYDGTANDISIGRHGATVITGSASADMLTITAGDIEITAGDIDLNNGNLMVDTAQDLAHNISRDFAGAGSAACLTVNEDNTSSTSIALDINNDGTGAATGMRIIHDGDSPVIDLSAGAARDGDVISIAMANMLDERALYVSGAITGAAGEGVIEVHATGVIPATATLLRLDADTAQPGDGDGYMMNIDDDTLVVATPSKYAVLIDSNANEALHVATGKALFDETATFTAGLDVNGDVDIDLATNANLVNIDNAATDIAAGAGITTIYGSGAAGQTNASYLLRLAWKANGDAQDNFILCEDNSTGAAANGDDMFKVDTGGAVTAASTVTATGGLSAGDAADTFLHMNTVELSNADIKALRGTKKELVAAPGANKFVEVVSVVLILDKGTEVLTESTDNLVVEYATSGDDITAAIEMTGFIDQAADTIMAVGPSNPLAANAASDMVNNAVQLFNTGDGEFAGNGSNDATMTVKIAYRIHADGL